MFSLPLVSSSKIFQVLDNLLDIVLTTNPSLVKTSKNTPGISDHEMIVTDCDTKPYYQRSKPRKCYIYSKANWSSIKEEITKTSTKIRQMQDREINAQEMSDTFKKELFKSMDKHIPSKEIRSKNNLPWINHKIRKLFKKKQRLYHQAKKSKKWTNYRHFQKGSKTANQKSRILIHKRYHHQRPRNKQLKAILEVYQIQKNR
ncbi:unnamed protein product [Mytilus edulis]|uniref:Endonuclease-reverse transcriptase n=1 Tax=Mytilus edulis TaxID=6550 RepID=A0A8S3V6I9_MYTED|nr:unnamed protein product [Mytilus edulis]